MSQVGAISKAQIKSKGGPFRDKKIEKKSHSAEKKRNGGPFTLIRFSRLRLKSEKPKRGPFAKNQMRFLGI